MTNKFINNINKICKNNIGNKTPLHVLFINFNIIIQNLIGTTLTNNFRLKVLILLMKWIIGINVKCYYQMFWLVFKKQTKVLKFKL